MIRRISLQIAVIAAFGLPMVSTAAEAPAAWLASAEGSVMANQGREFVPVSAGIKLVSGDRIMVLEGGRAIVGFAGGCTATVDPGKVITIPAQSPCVDGVAVLQDVDPQLTGPLGGADTTFDPIDFWIAGGTVAALAGLWIAFGDSDGDGGDDATVSP